MDGETARALIRAERERAEQLLGEVARAALEDRELVGEGSDMADPAEWLTVEEGDDAVVAGLRQRLEALERAEQRLDAGTYGRSIRSGLSIPDERLEADPAAELTVDEALAER